MSTSPDTRFDELAEALRLAVVAHYAERGEALEGRSAKLTLATNSSLVGRRARPLLEMLAAHAGVRSLEGLDVLDIGCGFGALSVFFGAQGARVTGVDLNGSRFEVGRAVGAQHGLELDFAKAGMQSLPLPDARFDLAVMNNSLCYVTSADDRHAALREAARVLRPGGWLVVRDPNRWARVDPFTSLPLLALLPHEAAGRAATRLGRARSRVRLVSPPGARAELKRAGLVNIVHARVPGRRRPRAADLVASYLHVLGRLPDA